MQTLIETNDIVFLSWIKNILENHNVNYCVMDESMSFMEGNISAIPIRVLVDTSDVEKAKKIIQNEKGKL